MPARQPHVRGMSVVSFQRLPLLTEYAMARERCSERGKQIEASTHRDQALVVIAEEVLVGRMLGQDRHQCCDPRLRAPCDIPTYIQAVAEQHSRSDQTDLRMRRRLNVNSTQVDVCLMALK